MVRIILTVCQYCQRVGKRAIGYVKEKSCSILKSRAEMVRGREDHLDGGGHPSRGHKQEEHRPHPGADRAGQIVGKIYALLKSVQPIVQTRISNIVNFGLH